MKTNYDQEMLEQLKQVKGKTILLHSCCGPCSSYVIKELTSSLKVVVFYYNPNIYPKEEYEKRKEVQKKIITEYQKQGLDVSFLDCDYDAPSYEEAIQGYEQEKEGGARCSVCFRLRLTKTAKKAMEEHYDLFGTTLTVSPHKNAEVINQIGKEIEKTYSIPFLVSDFKKREGYKKSIAYSKEYDLYRQDYCGCKYSIRKKEEV